MPFLTPTHYGLGERCWELETSSAVVEILPLYLQSSSDLLSVLTLEKTRQLNLIYVYAFISFIQFDQPSAIAQF